MRIQTGRDCNESRRGARHNAVGGSERAQCQQFAMYYCRQNRSRRRGSARHQLSESVETLANARIHARTSQFVGILDQIGRCQ